MNVPTPIHDDSAAPPAVMARLLRLLPLLALAVAAGCTAMQLDAANLIETAAVPHTEVAYGDGPRQRMDVYGTLDSTGAPRSTPAPVVILSACTCVTSIK